MMRTKIAAGLIVLLASIAGPAGAVGTPVIVSGPGSFVATYTQPLIVASIGDDVVYVNLDAQRHDVVADGHYRPDGSAPWCVLWDTNACPLFWTPLIGLGQQTPILGLDDVTSGMVYDFTCSIHPNMFGKLAVT